MALRDWGQKLIDGAHAVSDYLHPSPGEKLKRKRKKFAANRYQFFNPSGHHKHGIVHWWRGIRDHHEYIDGTAKPLGSLWDANHYMNWSTSRGIKLGWLEMVMNWCLLLCTIAIVALMIWFGVHPAKSAVKANIYPFAYGLAISMVLWLIALVVKLFLRGARLKYGEIQVDGTPTEPKRRKNSKGKFINNTKSPYKSNKSKFS